MKSYESSVFDVVRMRTDIDATLSLFRPSLVEREQMAAKSEI